jgi:hypothetical protein
MIPATNYSNASHRRIRPSRTTATPTTTATATATASSSTAVTRPPCEGFIRAAVPNGSDPEAVIPGPDDGSKRSGSDDDDGRIRRLLVLPRTTRCSACTASDAIAKGPGDPVVVAGATIPTPSTPAPPEASPSLRLEAKAAPAAACAPTEAPPLPTKGRASQQHGRASKSSAATTTTTMWKGASSFASSSSSSSSPSSSSTDAGAVATNGHTKGRGDEPTVRPGHDPTRAATPEPPSSALVSSSNSSSSSSSSPVLHGEAMVVTDDYSSSSSRASSSSSSVFAWQKLSLDRAVAPLLKEPVAPFVSRNRERKRALLSATYYSECFLRSIGPADADTAALDAQSRYEKWWVGAKFRGGEPKGGRNRRRRGAEEEEEDECSNNNNTTNRKRRRLSVVAGSDPADTVFENEPGPTPRKSAPFVGGLVESDDDDDGNDDDDDDDGPPTISTEAVKAALVEDLRNTGGDVESPLFVSCLDRLHAHYRASGIDERWGAAPPMETATAAPATAAPADGTWIALSKPTFTECHGRNDRGQYLYTLGRLSFDMFRPTSLLCSLRGVFNTVSLPVGDDESKSSSSKCNNAASSSSSSSSSDGGTGTKGSGGGGRGVSDMMAAVSASSGNVEQQEPSGPVRQLEEPPPPPSAARTCPRRMVRSLQEKHGTAGAPVRSYEYVCHVSSEVVVPCRWLCCCSVAPTLTFPFAFVNPCPACQHRCGVHH